MTTLLSEGQRWSKVSRLNKNLWSKIQNEQRSPLFFYRNLLFFVFFGPITSKRGLRLKEVNGEIGKFSVLIKHLQKLHFINTNLNELSEM